MQLIYINLKKSENETFVRVDCAVEHTRAGEIFKTFQLCDGRSGVTSIVLSALRKKRFLIFTLGRRNPKTTHGIKTRKSTCENRDSLLDECIIQWPINHMYVRAHAHVCTRIFRRREDIILVLCIQCASREFIRRRDAGAHEHVSSRSFDNKYTGYVQWTVSVWSSV